MRWGGGSLGAISSRTNAERYRYFMHLDCCQLASTVYKSSSNSLLLRMSVLQRQAVLYLNRRERLLCLRFLLPLVLICLVLEDAAVEDPSHVLLAHHAVIGP